MLNSFLGEIEFCLAKFEFCFVFWVSYLLSCMQCVLEASSAIIHSCDWLCEYRKWKNWNRVLEIENWIEPKLKNPNRCSP